ncbi:glycosyltransferase family 29 protein [Demequina oxidasica]|uniref:glycosyltransferase family 29 protein n=1 Tax=Demequina oxidasica TaxID=676199 RepID=UPI000786444C|nr:glycosyltransferase family 29 protein [Demequina oxidasica]
MKLVRDVVRSRGAFRKTNAAWWRVIAEAQVASRDKAVAASKPHQEFVRAIGLLTLEVALRQRSHALKLALGAAPIAERGQSKVKRSALDAATAALRVAEPTLAISLAELVATADPGSPAAQRILLNAYQVTGDRTGAKAAFRALHTLTGDLDSLVAPNDEQNRSALEELIRLPTSAAPDPESAAHAVYGLTELALSSPSDMPERIEERRSAIASVTTALPFDVADRAARHLVQQEVLHGSSLRTVELATRTVAMDRLGATVKLPPDAVTEFDTIDVAGLANRLRGRSVAVIANSQAIAKSGLGSVIDSYDEVIRFNSFIIDPGNTGSKTTIHAMIHMHDFNWDVPVDVRIVFGGNPVAWRTSLVKHLRPQAQSYLGDESLRWPVRSKEVVADDSHIGVPTSGFNMLRLLDFLDVSPVIDLVGFDFYRSGAYRLKSAQSLQIATAHNYEAEREWVAQHTTRVSGIITSLRGEL